MILILANIDSCEKVITKTTCTALKKPQLHRGLASHASRTPLAATHTSTPFDIAGDCRRHHMHAKSTRTSAALSLACHEVCVFQCLLIALLLPVAMMMS